MLEKEFEMANTNLLNNGSTKIRRNPTGDSTLLWHGSPPSPGPLDPSGWRPLGIDFRQTYMDGVEVGRRENIVLSSGDFLELPPFDGIPNGCTGLQYISNISSYVINYADFEIKFSYISWTKYVTVPNTFKIPTSLGLPLSSSLRATGLFRLNHGLHNVIATAGLAANVVKAWDVSLHLFGKTFRDARIGNQGSYPNPKSFVFQHAGLANHINTCMDNNSLTEYPTALPYVTGTGDLSLNKNNLLEWNRAFLLENPPGDPKPDSIEHYYYYPFNNREAYFGTQFSIDAYYS